MRHGAPRNRRASDAHARAARNGTCFHINGEVINGEPTMLDKTSTKFSHNKPSDTQFEGHGLRDFFVYRDLGVADATAGNVLVHLTRANNAPEKGTGWHYHEANFHVVIMLK